MVRKILRKLKTVGILGVLDAVLTYILDIVVPMRLRFSLWSFDCWYRYHNARRLLVRKEDASGLTLDVGGGSGGFADYASKLSVIVCELDLKSAVRSVQSGKMTVCANGVALPFASRSVRHAVSLHVLEHVYQSQRRQFLSELARVSAQTVVVICPAGNYAEMLSKRVIAFWERHGLHVPLMALEHLERGIPVWHEMITVFDSPDWEVESFYSRNYYLELVYSAIMQVPVLRILVIPILFIPMLLLSRVSPAVELTLVATRRRNPNE